MDLLQLNQLTDLGLSALLPIFFYIFWKLINNFENRLKNKIEQKIQTSTTNSYFKSLLDINSKMINKSIFAVCEIILFITRISLIYLFLTYFVLTFPLTKKWSIDFQKILLAPAEWLISGFLNVVPNVAFITVMLFLTYYFLKGVKYIFLSLKDESFKIDGFHPDWAMPTYQLLKFFIFVILLVICFPFIPGSESQAFKGLSVFMGLLISLGSSSAISNIMSGLVITYMRPFRHGDRIQIGEITGDVVEKNLLITRVRTIKNLDVTIPNSMILSNHITNYSFQAQKGGILTSVTLTIGYSTPWRLVHTTLIEAAQRTSNIIFDPAPFIIQTSLNDFHVSYELNVWTDSPTKIKYITSDLNQNIQDTFGEKKIEIMSPSYFAKRDGSALTIPKMS